MSTFLFTSTSDTLTRGGPPRFLSERTSILRRNTLSLSKISITPAAFSSPLFSSLLFSLALYMGRTLPLSSTVEYYARLASSKIRTWTRFARPDKRDKVSSSLVMSQNKEAAAARLPLSEVVAECVRRWFAETLKEARGGDTSMQVLVGQMYHNGYGVQKNEQKARAWIEKASRYRSSVWKVSDKRPGYNASDSDSEDDKETKK